LLQLDDVHAFIMAPSVAFFIFSVAYRVVIDKIRYEREEKERLAERLTMELKFLRSQINPHFLFNVLTNLVSLARKKSDQLETSLLMLSGLMRYMLYDTHQKVSLRKEVEYLNSYIALQQLRFGNEVRIINNILLPDENAEKLIEPMLLIPFVENAFKHGVGFDNDPEIVIKLAVIDGDMTFEVINKFQTGPQVSKDSSSGIGLANLRARLNLLYQGNYDLTIGDQNGVFHVILKINLS
jgi:sensor histidine kinase YesM